MGTGASVPDVLEATASNVLDGATAKELVGEQWNQELFDAQKDADGKIKDAEFEELRPAEAPGDTNKAKDAPDEADAAVPQHLPLFPGLNENGPMAIVATKGSAATKPGWLQVEIQNLDGNGVDLLVMPQATVLQMKHAVAKAEGTPPFQQCLWAEGSDEEMQNMRTAAENGLTDRCKVFLVKVSEHMIG
jgi:hypothetical protein